VDVWAFLVETGCLLTSEMRERSRKGGGLSAWRSGAWFGKGSHAPEEQECEQKD
jgi:hypothetical protein